jgi:hypothetical protein
LEHGVNVGDRLELTEPLPGRRGLRVGARGIVLRNCDFWNRLEVKFDELPGSVTCSPRHLRVVPAEQPSSSARS